LTREQQVGDLETLGRCSRRWWVMCTCWGGGDFGKVLERLILISVTTNSCCCRHFLLVSIYIFILSSNKF